MNIKKLFALLAGVSLVAQTVVPSAGVFGATYSEELQGAYDWAYSNGVTTMSPIDNANMYGAITRAEMAKMLSVYAKDVLGKKADSSKACEFTDIDSVKGDLHDYIIESCQLGIMGQGITEFRPYSTITRAEFGTALSRVLYGDVNNGGNPYYAKHLSALKADGIMTQIDNPTERDEIRGYVMLMLQRSDEGGAGVDCDDATIGLVCLKEAADGEYKDCPVACRDDAEDENKEEEKDPEAGVAYGTLAVDAGSVSVSQVPMGVAGVEMGSIKFKAGDEDVKLTSIDLTAIGYGRYTNLKNVYLVDKNGNRVTRERNIDSDGNVSLDFLGTYELDANSTNTFTIAGKINGGQNGDTYGFKVTEITGPEKVTGLPVETDLVSAVTINNLGTATFSLPALTTETITIGDEAVLGELKIAQNNQKEDLKLVSLKVKHEGSASLDSLDNLYLAINGESVADKAVIDGKYITFTFNDGGYVISKDRATALTVKLMGTATAEPGKSVKFIIDAVEDFVIKGETYGYTVDVAGLAADTAITANARNITAADIATSFEKNVNKDILATQSDVLFGTLKIKSNENNFEFENLYATITTNYATVAAFEAAIKNVKLGGRAGDLVNYYDKGAGRYVAVYKFEGVSLSKGTQRVLDFTMDTKGAAGAIDGAVVVDDINVAVSLMIPAVVAVYQNKLLDIDNDVTYLGHANTDDVLSAQNFSNTMTVRGASLKVSKKALPDASYVASNGKEIVIAKGTLEAGSNSDVKITNIIFTDTEATNPAISNNVIGSAKLVIGEKEYKATVDTTAKTYTVNKEIIVAKGSEGKVDFELVVTLKSDVAAAKYIKAGITNVSHVTAEDSEGTAVNITSTIPLFSTITLNTNGSLAITSETTDNNKYAESILAGQSDVVAEYQIKANNEKVRAQTVEVVFSDDIDDVVDSVVLSYNGKDYTATPDDDIATFTDIDMDVNTTKAPLTISVNTIAYANNSDTIVKNITVDDINVTKGYGIDSLENITFNTAIDASKQFDVVPATVVAAVKSSTPAKTELELTVVKGDNTKSDEADFALSLTNLLFDVSFNTNGLESFNVKDSDNNVILEAYTTLTETTCKAIGGGAATWTPATSTCTFGGNDYTTLTTACTAAASFNMDAAGKYCAKVTPVVLNAGNNLFTVNYTVGSANTPSYTIDLKDVQLSANYTAPMTYGNRMASTLTLVTK